jgi:hypothetical protein
VRYECAVCLSFLSASLVCALLNYDIYVRTRQRVSPIVSLVYMKKSEHMLLPSGTPIRTSAPDEDTDDFNDFGTSGRITTLVPPKKSEYQGLRVG